ncbi:growth-regulating factor 7-like isoform X2 [Primulina huaijiensis]|uniref:growth-regulating factor 7-like isoform X2 n=1 Tax=Primulina huaijiensis TaxID=1492673 RepID=UPI003CC73225
MDFGLVGLDDLGCSSFVASESGSFDSENGAQIKMHKFRGSRFFKQDRALIEEDFKETKVAKTSSCGEEMLKIPLQTSNNSDFIEGQQMLSFSSSNSQNVAFPYFQPASSSFSRSTGMTGAGMHGVLSGVRGPFTPSQWMELEHQALIYKYITANVPIPSYLLNPIRKALESAGFSTFSGLRSNALGWGAFHIGYPNTDPEPGRCRRTDGKKWRCSKDAVTDQKYCERHMNRGRHRSRKPVEGQSGHSASGITNTNVKPTPIISSASASVVPAGGVSNSLGLSHRQLNNQQVDVSNANSLTNVDNVGGVYQHMEILSMASSGKGLQENQRSISKRQSAYDDESCHREFGLVTSDSLINPLNRSSTDVTCRNYSDSNFNRDNGVPQHSLRQFMDGWPKNMLAEQRSAVPWLESDPQPDRTQLSISIPVVTSTFMPQSSPTTDNLETSPLTLSREHRPIHMGLGFGLMPIENNQRGTNWIPISWEPSIGGPLGEVLHNPNNISTECDNDKALNLMEGWDNSSQQASSPTGVLQRGAFASLSNSSAGSSPQAETNKTHDGASLRDKLVIPGATDPSFTKL